MRIGIDIRTLLDGHYSGIPEYSYRLIHGMLQSDSKNEYVLFYNSFRNARERIGDFSYPNVSLQSTAYPSKIFNYIMAKGLGWPELDRLLGVDVFFMPHLNFAAFSKKAKSIITIHDISFLLYPEYFSWRKNFWHHSLDVRRMLQRFDRIIAISQNTKADLMEYCQIPEERICVIYSGIGSDFQVLEKGSSEAERVRKKYALPARFILYLGTIEPRKNVDSLILAFERLCQTESDFSDLSLVIAGAKGWKYKETIKLIKSSPLRDKIILTGYVHREDKCGLYNLAETFVYPSFYEGFGFPPLEAMACGTPVVSCNNSSLSEALESAAIYADPYDVNSLKRAILVSLSDQDLRQRLVQRGLEQASRYRWQDCAQKTLALIQNTLGEN
jgi:glycosyltransferase involved in cell wall biosynthesis